MNRRWVPYKPWLYGQLQDPQLVEACLREAILDDANVFLLSLRDVVESRGGVGAVAKGSKLNRQSLYRLLSEDGNPHLASVRAVLDALGLELSVNLKASRKLATGVKGAEPAKNGKMAPLPKTPKKLKKRVERPKAA